jgi:hypothetical protein
MKKVLYVVLAIAAPFIAFVIISLNSCGGKAYMYEIKEDAVCEVRIYTPARIDSAGLIYISDSIRHQRPACAEFKAYYFDEADVRAHLSWADVWYKGDGVNEVSISH